MILDTKKTSFIENRGISSIQYLRNNLDMKKSIRLSSIELLRILSMILIMFGHSHLRIHHLPNSAIIGTDSVSSYLHIMTSCVSVLGVNIFVAISGWFGIRFKKKGIALYLYQVLFILWAIYFIAIALNLTDLNFSGIKTCLSFYEGYWFVMGYLGLYLISPVLNTFVENASKREIQITLLSYYIFQSYYSWLSGWYNYYDGYSIFLFGGIYLTSAYLKKYPINWINKNSLQIWIAIILLMTTIAYFSLWKFGFAARQIRDDNPFVILASVLLVITFSKFKFQSRIVNWLAKSAFAVYLIHFNPIVYSYFMYVTKYVYTQFDGYIYSIVLIITLLIIYLCCVLFDQIRICSWNLLLKFIDKH